MTRVDLTELRRELSHYVRRVEAGETIDITRDGNVVARLQPADGHRARAREALARIRETAVVGDIESPLDVEWNA